MIRDASELNGSPNPIAAHYSRFRVGERLLLTGHSHQAWPDRAAIGQARAWEDAAEHVDAKWERAFERARRVRVGFAQLLDASPETICLGTSTHELIVKWLSALPLKERPCLVTTDAEFHSARRQLQRLEEQGLRVRRVPARPATTVGERLAMAVDDGVAAVITSTVFYDSAEIAGALEAVARACDKHGADLLLDTYHQLNVVPLSLHAQRLNDAFVTGGGYKYCQLGEGNCFLRSPAGSRLRPAITGWFAEFGELAGASPDRAGDGPLTMRFAGATYDPTSHYRAAEVFEFFADMGLAAPLLREVSQHQVGLLRSAIDELDVPPEILRRANVPLEELGGFLALRSNRAAEIQHELARRGILTDSRGDILRLGPAPYLSDDQLRDAVAGLGEVVRGMT
jgi:kynureninase